VAELAATLHTYRRLVGARIRADWQYRTSFILFLVGQAAVATSELGAVAVIFSSVDSLAGWSSSEVIFLYAITSMAFGIGDLIISQVEFAAIHIKAGTFDQFLIRPMGTLWQLSATEFAPRRLGRAIAPAVALAVVAPRVDVTWTPAAVALVALTIASGVAIFGSIWVITSSIAFWTVETQEIANSFTYGGNEMTSYPLDVLGKWLRRIATYVVPLAFVGYIPCAWLFDKPLPDGLPRAAAWASPLVALAAVLAARTVWGFAIRHYRSTGS
jgi:ABC-2 type transport system permease protein